MNSRWKTVVAFVLTCAALTLAGRGNGGGKPGGDGGGDPLTNPAMVFALGADLHLATSAGAKQLLIADGRAPVWTPDGVRIAFLRPIDGTPVTNLHFVDADGSSEALEFDFVANGVPHPDIYAGLDISPDGTKVLYSGDGAGGEDLYVLDLPSGTVQALGVGRANAFGGATETAAFGPDLDAATGFQGFIAYSHDAQGDGWNPDIYVVEVTTAADDSLVADLASITTLSLPLTQRFPRWSPDGTEIAYLDEATALGGKALMVVPYDSAAGFGSPQVLVDDGERVGPPTWSPDGLWIGFQKATASSKKGRKTNASTQYDLHRIRPDGTGLTNMTGDKAGERHLVDWNPAWTNDID